MGRAKGSFYLRKFEGKFYDSRARADLVSTKKKAQARKQRIKSHNPKTKVRVTREKKGYRVWYRTPRKRMTRKEEKRWRSGKVIT